MSEGHERALTTIALAVEQAKTEGATAHEVLVALLQAAAVAARMEEISRRDFTSIAGRLYTQSRAMMRPEGRA